jgi:hypothetical protein
MFSLSINACNLEILSFGNDIVVKKDYIFLKKNRKLCYVSEVLFYFCSIRASLHDAAESDVIILSKAKARASLPMNGKDDFILNTSFLFCLFYFI